MTLDELNLRLKNFKLNLNNIKEDKNQRKNSIENTFEFIKSDIELRIESLKVYFDQIETTLLKKINEECDDLRLNLKKTPSFIQQLKPCNEKIKIDQIGTLYYKFKPEQLKNRTLKFRDLSKYMSHPICMCITPRNELAILDYSTCDIFIFDKNLQLKNTIKFSGLDEITRPVRLISISSDFFLIWDRCTKKVFKIISNVSKAFQFKDKDGLFSDLECQDLVYENKKLYSLSLNRKNIDILSQEGDVQKTISLFAFLEKPVELKIGNCIVINDANRKINIFDMEGNFINSINFNETLESFILVDDFLVVHENCHDVNFYNVKSNFKKEFMIQNEYLNFNSNRMIYFNKNILINLPWKSKILII
ncbi:unnamed protein product [Brachionus calyciflorus]|uniref:Uncharacterized protein n=1 Tax=Brachionus calyciflorus TaxID=104777 RepID=A0A813TD94_9BILA|nr:unnamed protein product [Brachionus calyciflorus]